MMTVTKGQWFPLTISNVQYAGTDFDFQGAKDVRAALVSSLGTRAELSFEVTAYNELSAVSDGNIAPGKYSVEVTAVGSDGKNYRMRSPFAVIEITNSTTPSGSSKARIAGDNWELTADVEMHEGQARTYMSLLEDARKKALQAATDAEAVIDNVQSSVTQAQEAAKTAQEASTNADNAVTNANNAVSDANNALQFITTMEGTVSTAEQGRKDAESERVTAEQGRKDAESERVTAEQGRKDAETERSNAEQERKEAEQARTTAFELSKSDADKAVTNANAATEKANTAAANCDKTVENKVDYSKILSTVWTGTAGDFSAIASPSDGTMYLIDDSTTETTTTAGTGNVDKIWYGTRNDYDRLPSKEDGTLYMLVEEF